MVRSHFQLQKLTQRCILLTFYRYSLQIDGNQSMRARLWWMELLSGCRHQHRCCIRKKWVSYIDIQKTGKSLQLPLTFFLFQQRSLRFQEDRRVWGRFGWLELLPCWRQQGCHIANSRIRTRDGCDARPVMATSMMAAVAVETQSTMGGGEGERMGVVQALR